MGHARPAGLDGPTSSLGLRWSVLLALGWALCWSALLLGDHPRDWFTPLERGVLGATGVLLAFALGVCSPPRMSLLLAVAASSVVLLVPSPVDPQQVAAQARGGCDPFCSTGGSVISFFGPFTLLLIPLAVLPTAIGAGVRSLRRRLQ